MSKLNINRLTSAVAVLALMQASALAQVSIGGVSIGGDGSASAGASASVDSSGGGTSADVDATLDLGSSGDADADASFNLGEDGSTDTSIYAAVDINGDGVIDGKDASIMASLDVNGDGTLNALDDVNGDGVLNILDVDGADAEASLTIAGFAIDEPIIDSIGGSIAGGSGEEDGIGNLAELTPNQLRDSFAALSESEAAVLMKKCGDVLDSPGGSSDATVAVCQVIDTLRT